MSSDFYKSFTIYQDKCLTEYEQMKKDYHFVSIDGTLGVYEIHKIIVEKVQNLLDEGKLD